MKKKVILFSLLVMAFMMVMLPVSADSFSDVDTDHWAYEAIEKSAAQNIAGGYSDGTFQPDKNISRAEFVTLFNRKFNFDKGAPIDFSDAKEEAWYYQDLQVAVGKGYVGGYPDGTIRPDAAITRQEIAMVVSNALDLEADITVLGRFKDTSTFKAWSKPAIAAVVDADIMTGYEDKTFKPARPITRAEAIQTLENLILIVENQQLGSETDHREILSNVHITEEDTVVQNVTIKGDLIVEASVDAGDVTLRDVVVEGETYVYGGGSNSIHLNNTILNGQVTLNNTQHPVRLVLDETSQTQDVLIQSAAILESTNTTGSSFGTVDINVPERANVELRGRFNQVNLTSKGATLTLADETEVDDLAVSEKASIKGNGRINKAHVTASGVSFDQRPADMDVSEGISRPSVPSTSKPSTPSDDSNQPDDEDESGEESPAPEEPTLPEEDDEAPVEETPMVAAVLGETTYAKTVGLNEEVTLPSEVDVRLSNGEKKAVTIHWDGDALTDEVGTFNYEGIIKNDQTETNFTFDLTVELTGYSEKRIQTEAGYTQMVAYVENQAALDYAHDLLYIDRIVITAGDAYSLPDNFSKALTIQADTTVDFLGASVDDVVLLGNDITLKNGQVESINYSDAGYVTLDGIIDTAATEHTLSGPDQVNFIGKTEIKGDVVITAGPVTVTNNATVTGQVIIQTADSVTLTGVFDTVVVDAEAYVRLTAVEINTLMVRQNATIISSNVTVYSAEKREGVTITQTDVQTSSMFRIASVTYSVYNQDSIEHFEEVLDLFDLDRYLRVLNTYINHAEYGNEHDMFPVEQKGILQTAYDEATIFKAQEGLSQTDVDQKVDALKDTLTAFGESRIFIDSSDLRYLVRSIEQTLARTTVGNFYGQVSETTYNELAALVDEAKTSIESGLTAEETEALESSLERKYDIFKIERRNYAEENGKVFGSVTFYTTNDSESFINGIDLDFKDRITGYSTLHGGMDAKIEEIDFENEPNPSDILNYKIMTSLGYYEGTFTAGDYMNNRVIDLEGKYQKDNVSTIDVDLSNFEQNVEVQDIHLVEETTDRGFSVKANTLIPNGKYAIGVVLKNNNHLYLLEDSTILEGGNQKVVFDNDIITYDFAYENFTGYESELNAVDTDDLYLHVNQEDNIEKISVSPTLDSIDFNFGAYESGNKWLSEYWYYRVSVNLADVQNQEITVTNDYEIKLGLRNNMDKVDVINPYDPLFIYFDLKLENAFGHELVHAGYYQDDYDHYLGSITITDDQGKSETYNDEVYQLMNLSVKDLLPEAKDNVEITFDFNGGPFIMAPYIVELELSEDYDLNDDLYGLVE